jgi:two-component system sensor histidine kinase CreC
LEIVELGEQLEHMRQQLEGKQYVEQTIHSLTHEMKNPLAAIQGASELLSDERGASVPADVRQHFIGNIKEQSSRLNLMVEKMLSLAALEHKQTLENRQPLALPSLLQDVVALSDVQASQKNVVLRLLVSGEAETGPSKIPLGDAFLVKQALTNLLENALAFAPGGSAIEIALASTDTAATISVRDHGPGIPPYAMPRLFERFFSLPRPDGKEKSTGLGLCFVKEIAELHQGSIHISNAEDGGVLAVLALPLAGRSN